VNKQISYASKVLLTVLSQVFKRITLTSAQPLGSRSPVLSHRHVQLNRSLSHCVSQENHLEYHLNSLHRGDQYIVSSLSQRERHTQLMGFLTPHRGTQHSIFVSERNHTPSSWASSPHTGAHNVPSPSQRGTTYPTNGLPHPTQGNTTFHLRLREEPHTHLMGTPNSWALSQVDSLSLCLGGRLTQL
jgi:hypothetical protein